MTTSKYVTRLIIVTAVILRAVIRLSENTIECRYYNNLTIIPWYCSNITLYHLYVFYLKKRYVCHLFFLDCQVCTVKKQPTQATARRARIEEATAVIKYKLASTCIIRKSFGLGQKPVPEIHFITK